MLFLFGATEKSFLTGHAWDKMDLSVVALKNLLVMSLPTKQHCWSSLLLSLSSSILCKNH